MQLALRTPRRAPLGARLYADLRNAIQAGELKPGERLPSSREMVGKLRLSRNTITTAYERLVAEGYLEARRGSGTFVSPHGAAPMSPRQSARGATQPALTRWARSLAASRSIVPARSHAIDFRPGQPDLSQFPVALWRRLAARTLRRLKPEMALYGDPQGILPLRTAIARYLASSRAVVCTPEDIVIVSGSQQGLDLLSRLLVERGTVVAVEEPGYPMAKAVFRAMGARIAAVPVDGEGICVERLPGHARLAYVTPSHQFPLGVTLSLGRRKALLEWAARHNAVVIEDDYDSEFRFGERPLESLQGLDQRGSVVYLGTFSKLLFPALRLGYVVLPRRLREAFLRAKWLSDRHTPSLEQEIMAAFMAEGHFARYLRRMQRVYEQRQTVLMDALQRSLRPTLDVLPAKAGLHVTAWLPGRFDVDHLIRRADEAGVGLYSIASFFSGRPRPGLIFGYGACSSAGIEEGVRRMRGIIASMESD